jgi:hypothetical protein
MVQWFGGGDQAYTKPELLFRGAAKCAAASKASQGSGIPVSISKSGFNTECLSNMRVCTWNLTPGKDYNPLFTDCKDQDAFQGLQTPTVTPGEWCKETTSTNYFRAYRQYLGWGILKSNTDKTGATVFCPGDEELVDK